MDLLSAPKVKPGDQVAVLSPSFAAPGFAPAVHEQAMERLRSEFSLVPVEYPTTRQLGAPPAERARDLLAAFADPSIKAVLTTIGGDDQITVLRHLDRDTVRANPKPFLGYSDNTHLHNYLTGCGVASFYGGSTQIHIGAGPAVDAIHAASFRAALYTGETLELTEPGESEDYGHDWLDPRALTEFGQREETEPWQWSGAGYRVAGRAWGGCLEVVNDILAAGHLSLSLADLTGSVLLLETSEEVAPVPVVHRMLRNLGERGILGVVAAVLFARPPVRTFAHTPTMEERQVMRAERYDTLRQVVERYQPEAVVCCGVPFGHTRPQWIVPYGGKLTVDGQARRIWADYS